MRMLWKLIQAFVEGGCDFFIRLLNVAGYDQPPTLPTFTTAEEFTDHIEQEAESSDCSNFNSGMLSLKIPLCS